MSLFAFQLGRKTALCFGELLSVLGEKNLVEKITNTPLFEIAELGDPQALQDRLGGTIKIIEIFDAVEREEDVESALEEYMGNFFKGHRGKMLFALNVFNSRKINIKKTLNFLKVFLKNFLRLSCRFVNKDFKENPKPSTIYKARILRKGIDLNIIQGKKIYLGRTVAIQNIDSYSKRDYDKPYRDAKAGMMPPKLAQIMINLAGEPETIYDPFCGTGTVLMEGLLMGKKVIGSDIEPRFVDFSKRNCLWLLPTATLRVFVRDAQFIDKKVLPETPDAIVTECYLGPPQSRVPHPDVQEKIFRELGNVHSNWLKKAREIIAKDGKIVMCLPAFRSQNTLSFMPRFEEIATESGFTIEQNFVYDRPDQTVAREIIVLHTKEQ